MFKHKYINFGFFSLVSIMIGIAISVSYVTAEPQLENYSDTTQSYIIHISDQQELSEENINIEEDIEEYGFYVKGMTSTNCEVKVKDALLKCAGVHDVSTSHEDGYTVIEADNRKMDANEIIGAVEKAGYKVIEEE